MKKFILLIICMLISVQICYAKSVKVEALTPFNSQEPVPKMKVIVLEHAEFKNGIVFENGTVLKGEVFDVKDPKIGKRNATFKFRPEYYLYNGKKTKISDGQFIAKYKEYKPINKVKIAETAATTAGSYFLNIPFLSQGYSFAKGVWRNEESNIIKSGVVQVYKDSPLTYLEEGNDLDIKEKTIFVLKFKSSDADDLDAPDDVEIQEEQEPEELVNKIEEHVEEHVEEPAPKSIQTTSPEDILQEIELKL